VAVKAFLPILLAAAALLAVAPAAFAGSGVAVAGGPTAAHNTLARVGIGGFGSRGFGRNRGFGSRNRGFGRRGRGRGIFRSIIRALALGYLLHLLFTTPGGLFVLVLMIIGVMLLVSRFRRRRMVRY
jgi:hypothetical protein